MNCKTFLLLGITILIHISDIAYSQNKDTFSVSLEGAPKIFIDSEDIDLDFVRREVNFVNYVRDRRQADIYILETTRRTASGGREYTFTYTGFNNFEGMVDTLYFNSTSFATEDEIRIEFIKTLKLGLMPYILQTPIANNLKIEFDGNGNIEEVKDKWDYWVFRMRLSGSVSGEQLRDNYFVSGGFNADRITEDWKIRFDADIDYDEEKYKFEEDTTLTASSRRLEADVSLVKAISSRWSLGIQGRAFSSTYRNIKSSYQFSPAIEYDVFPYSESTYREIRISYYLGVNHQTYFEETIYEKTEEILVQQGIQLDIEVKQPWGEIEIRGEYSNYLHDFSKRRFKCYGALSFNLFEGFSLYVGGGYSRIHDQLSLPLRDLDIEEILLRRAELATQYSYEFSFGLSYTFGAIYNNIVNPRFGN